MMASDNSGADFSESLGCLIDPVLGELATQTALVPGLQPAEQEAVVEGARATLTTTLHRKLARLLLLELHAARVTGRLKRKDSRQRWFEFLEMSSLPSFWRDMAVHYPTMPARVDRLLRNRCEAALAFARAWISDRAQVGVLCSGHHGDTGTLQFVRFGAGDSHCGGRTVALIQCEAGSLVYKPRSLSIDRALKSFVEAVAKNSAVATSMRVPKVITREDHGWSEFITHRYAIGDELREFYRGVGHWLAVMRLLGGTDLHSENLIAQGRYPVVVDCETLFTPIVPSSSTGCGHAADRASALVTGSVLNIGLLPGRASALMWRGVDNSAVGNLPGQQPKLQQPGILLACTDEAHLGTVWTDAPIAENHPSAEPALTTQWPEVMGGFEEMTNTLRAMDQAGQLRRELDVFANCPVRVVVRSTESYSEIARMLWHPVSLHGADVARERATDLLTRMAANQRLAPSDSLVIEAEIDELLFGDIPYFSTTVKYGQLDGPAGTQWLAPRNLLDSALEHWRNADLDLDRNVTRVSLVTAYISDGGDPHGAPQQSTVVRGGDLDGRRRRLLFRIMEEIVGTAIRGEDGTATWIAPVFSPSGWSVRPLGPDLYSGLSGVALVLGAYRQEAAANRVDQVDRLDELFEAVLLSLDCAEAVMERDRLRRPRSRPPECGGYIGLGSQIWARLVLTDWQIEGEHLSRARALAQGVESAVAADKLYDLLAGRAGAIVPLLALYRRTRDQKYLQMSHDIGEQLCALATVTNNTVFWDDERWPKGIGGFAHGVSGIGWALSWLARATGEARHAEVARQAMAFEDSLFDQEEQNWLDLRGLGGPRTAATWCHGAVGIGLSRLDLDSQLMSNQTRISLRRAAEATWRLGLGWTHSPCHGDTGAWELLLRACESEEAPADVGPDNLLAFVLSSIEDRGIITGLTRNASPPGLMSGLGGIAYQLLRSHPDCRLPSILTLGGGNF